MPRLEGGHHGLNTDPSARADDQDYRHGIMLRVGPAWLSVMCDAGSRTARCAGGLKPFLTPLPSHAARRRSTVNPIPIADQVARGLIPRECLRDLAVQSIQPSDEV